MISTAQVVLSLELKRLGVHGKVLLFFWPHINDICTPPLGNRQISLFYFGDDCLVKNIKCLNTSGMGKLFVSQHDITMEGDLNLYQQVSGYI